jgi:uncharacterized protein (DUF2267 family)
MMTSRHRPIGYHGILSRLERDTGLSRPDAERAIRATLETLAERLSPGQSRDLAEQLPPELARVMTTHSKAQAFDLDEFLKRVADREGASLLDAREHARAVFGVVGRTVPRKELADMAAELPKDFAPLLSDAEPPPAEQRERPPTVSADEFVQRVARRAQLDPAAARHATDAVLEALGDRISGGQVDDLADQLPGELYPPLQRGKIRSHAGARPLPLAEFVRTIAEREGVPPEAAREHARAVLSTLREAVSDKELSDTLAQLPDDYRALFAPAS